MRAKTEGGRETRASGRFEAEFWRAARGFIVGVEILSFVKTKDAGPPLSPNLMCNPPFRGVTPGLGQTMKSAADLYRRVSLIRLIAVERETF